MKAQSKLPEPKLPVFVDDIMIYFSTALNETYFCERDGKWNEETVNHPKLSLFRSVHCIYNPKDEIKSKAKHKQE